MGDIIKQIIDGFGDAARAVLSKEPESREMVQEYKAEQDDSFAKIIFSLLEKNKICEAEDMLYAELKQDFTHEKYLIAKEFYARLSERDESELRPFNFSSQEVLDGKQSLEALKDKNP